MVKLGLIALAIFLSLGVNKPFIGHHDWNGVYYANIARNYLRLGFVNTKLGQVTEFGPISQPGGFYTHYPPFLTLIMAAWFKVAGVGDWQARLVPLIFTVGSLWLLSRLFNYLKFSSRAALAGLAVGLTPMWRYFSKMPSQETLMIFFSLLSVLTLLKKQKKLFYLSVVLNGLTGWAGYFLYPWLLFLNRRRSWLVKAIVLLAVIFLLHIVHVYWLTGSVVGGGLLEALKLRLNLSGTEGFSWLGYLTLERQRLAAFYTLTLLAVAVISTIWKRDRLVLVLLGWGLSYPLIFSNVVFIHDYFNIFFIPWLAVTAAGFFERLKFRPAVFIFLTLVFFERDSFYRALAVTDSFRSGYNLGRQINQAVPWADTAYVVGQKDFIESQNLFISYYADRQIVYLTPSDVLPIEPKYVFNEVK